MRRREFLASSLGLVAAGALPGCGDDPPPVPAAGASPGADGKRRIAWQNWAGTQRCVPAARLAPATEDELAELLRRTPGPIRPVGAGHSFTALVPTDGTIVSLRNFDGLLAHDAGTATLGGGTKLGSLGPLLDGIGQALPNMPDIDEQSLAGAIATATHGTGAGLGALHAYVTALRLVTPRGEVLDCSASRNAAVFEAARVSLGALGAVTQVTLQNAPAHRLKRRVWLEPLESLMERFDALATQHHSFEMYYLPFCDSGVAISIDPTDEPPRPRGPDQDNGAVLDMKRLRDATAWWPGLRRWLMNRSTRDFEPEEAVDVWYRIFPSRRAVRFNEMEYHLPREALMPTLRRVREILETRHPEIFFPVEVRTVRGDGAWLSPFQGHDVSGSIAVHHYHVEDAQPYFTDIEPVYQALEGRPHWGKVHTLAADTLSRRYPRWKEFLEVRAALDPEGKMLNPYLRNLLGLA